MAGLTGGGGGGGGFDYVQDSEPADPSDSESWVDTSDPARTVRVYSVDRGKFVPTYDSVPLFVTQEAVGFGESALNMSNSGVIQNSGQLELVDDRLSHPTPDTSASESAEIGLRFVPAKDYSAIEATYDTGQDGLTAYLRDNSDGSTVESKAVSGGNTYQFGPVTAGKEYRLTVEASSNTLNYNSSTSWPYESPEMDVVGNYYDGDSTGAWNLWSDIRAIPQTSGTARVWFDMPTDIASWDRLTWQYDEGQGSLSFDVETDDGTGWSTYASGVLPPVSIADVQTDSDVRVVASFSRSSGGDTSPAVPYVARRAER